MLSVQAITRYFKRIVEDESPDTAEDPKPKKIKQFYNLRDVVKQHYRDRVQAEIPFEPNHPDFISKYQRAVTTVLNNMTEEDLEEANDVLDTWNKLGAPAAVQLKWVVKFYPPFA